MVSFLKLKKLIYIILLACCFAPSYLFIKLGIEEFPPCTIVFLRVFLAACVLHLLLKAQKRSFWDYRHYLKHFLNMGIAACALPFFLITYSEKSISSGLAGLINGSVPIFTAIMAHFYLPKDVLTPQKVLGISIGVTGLAFVLFPHFGGDAQQTSGILMVILSSISYAFGMVYAKKHLRGLPPLIAPTWQLTLASLILFPLCLLIDKPHHFPLPSLSAVSAILGLALIGSALAFVLYYQIIEIAGASDLSLCTFLFPLIAVFLGVIFLNEQLHWYSYLGGGLILSGLGVGTEMFIWSKSTSTD